MRYNVLVKQAVNDLKSPFPIRRWKSVIQLGKLRAISSGQNIAKCLVDSNPYVRMCAAISIKQIKYRQSAPDLIKLLKDNNWTVREKAIETLGVIGDHQSREVIESLPDDHNLYTKNAASIALANLKKRENLIGKIIFKIILTLQKIFLPLLGLFNVFSFSTKRF